MRADRRRCRSGRCACRPRQRLSSLRPVPSRRLRLRASAPSRGRDGCSRTDPRGRARAASSAPGASRAHQAPRTRRSVSPSPDSVSRRTTPKPTARARSSAPPRARARRPAAARSVARPDPPRRSRARGGAARARGRRAPPRAWKGRAKRARDRIGTAAGRGNGTPGSLTCATAVAVAPAATTMTTIPNRRFMRAPRPARRPGC